MALRIHVVQGERILAQPCESLLGCRSVNILDGSCVVQVNRGISVSA